MNRRSLSVLAGLVLAAPLFAAAPAHAEESDRIPDSTHTASSVARSKLTNGWIGWENDGTASIAFDLADISEDRHRARVWVYVRYKLNADPLPTQHYDSFTDTPRGHTDHYQLRCVPKKCDQGGRPTDPVAYVKVWLGRYSSSTGTWDQTYLGSWDNPLT